MRGVVERMDSLREVNKKLENKATENYVILRRDQIFREVEDRMLAAEARVKELEEILSFYWEESQKMGKDFQDCAKKLAEVEQSLEETN